jgi:hypothetical protein
VDGRVLAALAVLKERDREALTLVAWDGLTPAEAAAALGEPSARFRQSLHRAGRRLRAELADMRAAELRREELAALRHERAPHRRPRMNTRLDTDPELLDLVRRADPMRDPRVQANAGLDTESALRLLAPELDRPAPRRALRRRRTALRTAVLAGAVAAAVFVVANVASTGNGSAVSPAQAQAILRHVRDALAWPPHAVYEEESVTTNTRRDGARHTVEYHKCPEVRGVCLGCRHERCGSSDTMTTTTPSAAGRS